MPGVNGDPTTQAAPREGVIELALGHPSPALLPLDLLRRAAQGPLGGRDPWLLQYGPEPGAPGFRRALAAFLGEQYGAPVRPEELFVSNGVSQALDLICTLFATPGDSVLVEEPTYFLALRIFADHRLRVVGLRTDGAGLEPETVASRYATPRRASRAARAAVRPGSPVVVSMMICPARKSASICFNTSSTTSVVGRLSRIRSQEEATVAESAAA